MLATHITQLAAQVWEKAGRPEGQACLLFSQREITTACKVFATCEARGKTKLSVDDVTIRAFQSCVRLYAVFFPATQRAAIQPFWTHTGTGISSRLAEECLNHLEMLQEISLSSTDSAVPRVLAHKHLEYRIATLLQRTPAGPQPGAPVAPDDVYLFPTGMAAIYALHSYLLDKYNGLTALFGFVFRSSHYLFENLGPGCKLLGRGTSQELAELKFDLEERAGGRCGGTVQALITEFPTNPMLTSADLSALRRLADKYHFMLIVDDTIGGFANVDLLGVADVVITSLTKSFSGYADVMGGSVVLNPSSTRYTELKAMFDRRYHNDYWGGDAVALERNSRDYLTRSHTLNSNAERLVRFLHSCTADSDSAVSRVFYPTVNADREQYDRFTRKRTADFTPGYGCLFTIELDSTQAAIAFYDNLTVYKGPHLGAHLTLALPYCKALYASQLDWAARYGLKESQIRISVGLEDIESLLDAFKIAVQFADATRGSCVRKRSGCAPGTSQSLCIEK